MLNTASERDTSSESEARDRSVEVVAAPGTQATTAGMVSGEKPSGSCVTANSPLVSIAATTPPKIDAPTLSAWCSSSAVSANISHRPASVSTPSRCTTAAAAPPTRTAPLKPKPRPIGMGDRTHSGP